MDRVYQRVVAELLDDIVTGRIAAGEWLPKIDDIAARHACSPSTVREAIRALEERRVIEVHAGQGEEVLRDDRWMHLDHELATATLLRQGDLQLLREAVDFLRLLEARAAMLAARKVKHGDVALLGQILDQMRASSRGEDGDKPFADTETDFHRTLILFARNRFLASALEQLYPVIAEVRRRRAPDRDPSAIVLHERIVTALAERNGALAATAADDYGRHLASWLRV